MRNSLVISLLFLFSIPVFGQSVCPFEWAVQSTYTGGHDIATDSKGNSYITGHFGGSTTLGSFNLTSGSKDVFVAKIDSFGDVLWVTQAGGKYVDEGYNIAIDAKGNSYITGRFQDTSTFGSNTLVSSGYSDAFIAKLDTSGSFVWATKVWGSSVVQGYDADIVTEANGNCYITGSFIDSVYLDNLTLVSSGNSAHFIAKLDSSGNFLWATKLGGGGTPKIGMDIDGNIFVTATNKAVGPFDLSDIIITKLDSSGSFLWAKTASGNGSYYTRSLSTDLYGNCYITGDFSHTVTFGNDTLTSASAPGLTYLSAFVAKLDPFGNFLWAKQVEGISTCGGIITDVTRNCYVTGSFRDTVNFGNVRLISSGSSKDIYVASLDSSGNFLRAIRAGGNYGDGGYNIGIDANRNCYVIGSHTGPFGNSTINYLGLLVTKVSNKILSVTPMQSINLPCGKNTVINGSAFNYAGFQWSPTTGLSSDTILNPIASPTQTTEYTLTAWNSCGDTLREKLTVIVDPIGIDADANRAYISCGDTTRLNAALDTAISGVVSYSWSPAIGLDDPTGVNPVASPFITTTYTVTATTPNGCMSTDSVTIIVNNTNAPNISIKSSTGEFKLCAGGLILSATGYGKYEWSNGSIDSSVTVTQTGWYKLTAYPASGCPGIDSVEIAPFGNITAPLGTSLCDTLIGQKLTLNAAPGMDSYQWSNGELTQSIAVSQAGNYSVLMSKGSCTGSDTINTVMTGDSASIDFSHGDTGLTSYFTLIGTGIDSVFWDFGDGNTSTDLNPIHVYAQTGSYDVKVDVIYVCGISADTTKTIIVSDPNSINGVKKHIPKIYPNPACDKLWIEFPKGVNGSFSCEILNMQGQLVKQWNNLPSETAELDLANLAGGVYVLQLHYNGNTHIERLIKLEK